jgi:hypothetical protein
MHTIVQSNMLLRAETELPVGLRLATDDFHEGWNFVRTAGAKRMEKKILTRGWNFTRIAGESLRSGVGATSQEAIACALKLALRRISEHLNAAEVEHIELTQYPWFFLARVRIHPYRIQQSAVLPLHAEGGPVAAPRRQGRMSRNPAVLNPHFGSAMPQLKQLLISSMATQGGPQ